MAEHLIEVLPQDPGTDPASRSILSEALHLGAAPLKSTTASKLYRLTGPLSSEDAQRIARELLCDPIIESFTSPVVEVAREAAGEGPSVVIDVWYKPGVTDPQAWTIEQALSDMGYAGVKVRCGTRARFYGSVPAARLNSMAGKFLGNAVMQEWTAR